MLAYSRWPGAVGLQRGYTAHLRIPGRAGCKRVIHQVPQLSKFFKLIAVLIPGFWLALAGCADEEAEALQHARELLRASPLIDGHNDVAWLIREENQGDIEAFGLARGNDFDTDIPKLRAGQVGAQFWSVWIPGETTSEDAPRLQLEQIDIARRMIDAYPDDFELALTADDIERIFSEGKIASLLGMEGGYGLNNSMGALRAYYDLGVRYMTLVHNVTLDWVDAGLGEQRHGGLTAFGRLVVREMNRTGMLVDLAAEPLLVGSVSPADSEPELEDPEILESLYGGDVHCVLDAGPLWPDPSTVLRAGRDEIEVLREGQGRIPE